MRRWTIILLLLVIAIAANARPSYYDRMAKLPSDKLLSMGNKYLDLNQAPDSALVCYTIVANRYKADMNDDERQLCARAYIGKWYAYFFCYFDYSKSYESLTKAKELAEGFDDIMSRVWLNFGAMYQTMAEQGKDKNTLKRALESYKQSFDLSIGNRQGLSNADMSFANIISVGYDLGDMRLAESLYTTYSKLCKEHPSNNRQYNILLYDGKRFMISHEYAKAEECFEKQQALMAGTQSNLRYYVVAKINSAEAKDKLGDRNEAFRLLKEALAISAKANMKDAELELYDRLANLSNESGDIEGGNKFRSQYLELKDTLLNYRQLMSVSEMRFVNNMKEVDEQMQQMEQKRQRQQMLLGIVLVVVFIILVFFIIVWRKNKLLKMQNKSLYEKTLDTLNHEDRERKRREALENELQKIKENVPQKTEKYKYNNLSDDDKQEIVDKILRVMETKAEIYSPDFSAERLAELVGSRYKYVSQVINETYHCNFSTYLNEYRIKEACRRMADKEHYGHLTIEAISQEVGFRSRASFINAFKKFTGLTPSQFMQMSGNNG